MVPAWAREAASLPRRGRWSALCVVQSIESAVAVLAIVVLAPLMILIALIISLLARQPGTKESRYAHLLSGSIETAIAAKNAFAPRATAQHDPRSADEPAHEDRIAQLEATVAELRQEVAALRQKIDDLFGD